MEIIAFDSHKRYALASVETKDGKRVREERINHRWGEIQRFFSPSVNAGISAWLSWVNRDSRNDCDMLAGDIYAAETAKR